MLGDKMSTIRVSALLLGASAVCLLGSGAYAADLMTNTYTPPGVVEVSGSPFDGFYAGIFAGYASADADGYVREFIGNGSGDYFDGAFSNSLDGYLLGVQAGANFVTGNFLMGAEVSASLAALSGSTELSYSDFDYVDCLCSVDGYFTDKADVLASAVLKAGVVLDQTALYAKGGLALARVSHLAELAGNSADGYWSYDSGYEELRAGWTIGVGVEHMVTDNLSLGFSYDYSDFGSTNTQGTAHSSSEDQGESPAWFNQKSSLTVQTAKVFLNYHFD